MQNFKLLKEVYQFSSPEKETQFNELEEKMKWIEAISVKKAGDGFGWGVNRGSLDVRITSGILHILDEFLDHDHFCIPLNAVMRIKNETENLRSWVNFPKYLGTNNYKERTVFASEIWNNDEIDLEHFSSNIIGTVDFSNFSKLSYKNVHKHIFSLFGEVVIAPECVSPLLGWLNVKSLESIIVESTSNTDIYKIVAILDKHLKSSDKDILDCQEELITHGYKEYAKL